MRTWSVSGRVIRGFGIDLDRHVVGAERAA